jgi:hypothetical protein
MYNIGDKVYGRGVSGVVVGIRVSHFTRVYTIRMALGETTTRIESQLARI